eukprot:5520290-Prymnesium_polylepis.1
MSKNNRNNPIWGNPQVYLPTCGIHETHARSLPHGVPGTVWWFIHSFIRVRTRASSVFPPPVGWARSSRARGAP